MDERILALEKLLRQRRKLSAIALDLDGYERWGQGSDPTFARQAQQALDGRSELEAQLRREVAALRASDPDLVRAWAQAHIDLRQATLTAQPDVDADQAVRHHVAREEISAWQRVADGALDFVIENTAFPTCGPAGYRTRFGFDP